MSLDILAVWTSNAFAVVYPDIQNAEMAEDGCENHHSISISL